MRDVLKYGVRYKYSLKINKSENYSQTDIKKYNNVNIQANLNYQYINESKKLIIREM